MAQTPNDPYILTPCGYARRTKSGEIYDEHDFNGIPLFQLILDGDDHIELSVDQVDTMMRELTEYLKTCYKYYKSDTHWLTARVAFGGLGFEEFLTSPAVGKLPVAKYVVDEVKEAFLDLRRYRLSQAQRNLFLTLMFGQPVARVV